MNKDDFKNLTIEDLFPEEEDNSIKFNNTVYAEYFINDGTLVLNGDMIHKVEVQHKGKKYSFNMNKILEFLCEEVK